MMYAVTGITGQVGGAVARTLLKAGKKVRAVLRDESKAAAWRAAGCEIALAEMEDAESLAHAFADAQGVFILPPSCFDPKPDFPEARAVIDAVKAALLEARPGRAVCLSTIGAQARASNLLTQRTLLEQALTDLPMPVTFLRPGWFMENASWDVAPARETGALSSFLQPLDKPVQMVATADVGRVAAELLADTSRESQVVELTGPQPITPLELAAALGKAVGREVRATTVPREQWEPLFLSQGMQNPLPRIQMLDGFNEGWIRFEHPDRVIKGRVGLQDVLDQLAR